MQRNLKLDSKANLILIIIFFNVDPMSDVLNSIGLWGRSMGAAAALMYTELEKEISALCLDSPFSSLKLLIRDFMGKFKFIANLFGNMLYSKVSAYV